MAEQQLSAPVRARHGIPRAGVTHIRHRHTERFTVVGNHLAQHDELSLVAIGLAVYIQSKPDGTLITIKALTARFREGEVAIARALHELEAAGYLIRSVERLSDGRRSTRTTFRDCPEHLIEQAPAATEPPRKPVTASVATAPTTPQGLPPARQPTLTTKPEPNPPEPASPAVPEANAVLASLRAHDPRLLLSQRDVDRLAPALTTWLERGVEPDAAVRTLTADLPDGLIRRPAGIVAYRLANWLPPALPADIPGKAPAVSRPDPLQNCDGCDRAFRAPAPGRCRDCAEAWAAA